MPESNLGSGPPEHNASPDQIRALLRRHRVVAVVGLSTDPSKASHRVAAYLQSAGYRIVPIHPKATEILGERVYTGLREVPAELGVEIVDLFRPPPAVPPHIDEAIEIGAQVVWLQEGIVHDEAAQKALDAGLMVVQDRCMLKEHARLVG